MLLVEFLYSHDGNRNQDIVRCRGYLGDRLFRCKGHDSSTIETSRGGWRKPLRERFFFEQTPIGRQCVDARTRFVGLDEGNTHLLLYYYLIREIQTVSKVCTFEILRTSEGTEHYYQQDIRWGPTCLMSENGRIKKSWISAKDTTLIDPTWYTPEGFWANSEAEYLGREIHANS